MRPCISQFFFPFCLHTFPFLSFPILFFISSEAIHSRFLSQRYRIHLVLPETGTYLSIRFRWVVSIKLLISNLITFRLFNMTYATTGWMSFYLHVRVAHTIKGIRVPREIGKGMHSFCSAKPLEWIQPKLQLPWTLSIFCCWLGDDEIFTHDTFMKCFLGPPKSLHDVQSWAKC